MRCKSLGCKAGMPPGIWDKEGEEEKSLRDVGQASSSEPSVQSLYPSQTQLFTMQAPLLQR